MFSTIPAALGCSAVQDLDVNSLAIPRKAGAAVGAIMTLRGPGPDDVITINVEYNYIDALIKATLNLDGDVNGPDGYSPFPGNINQLIFKIGPYADTLKRTEGRVPEFVNPKYTDATRTKFKSPTRLECMMQDYPRSLDKTARVGVTVFRDQEIDTEGNLTHIMYCPVKNSITQAAEKSRKGVPGAGAAAGEMTIYAAIAAFSITRCFRRGSNAAQVCGQRAPRTRVATRCVLSFFCAATRRFA